jgi:hypothetical protein
LAVQRWKKRLEFADSGLSQLGLQWWEKKLELQLAAQSQRKKSELGGSDLS